MTTSTTTISGHLAHAGEIIDAIAEATVRATHQSLGATDARKTLAHIDAAKPLMDAAGFLFEAAERVAMGQPVDTPEMVFCLRAADAKAAEGRAMLAGK